MRTEKSPFESHQRAYKAFKECNEHFEEILETKKKEMYLGEDDSKGTMDLLGTSLDNILEAIILMRNRANDQSKL
jgi:hypothetical protein